MIKRFLTTDSLPKAHTIPQKLQKSQGFIDYKRLELIAGKAGDGGIAFYKAAGEPMGPPNGGKGGKGGDIYIRASKEMSNLNGILSLYRGGNGQNGRGSDLHGANGTDTEFVVPVGTLIKQIEPPHPNTLIPDTELSLEEYVDRYYVMKGTAMQRDRMRMLAQRVPKKPPTGAPIMIDMVEDGMKVLLARGGRGGQGNAMFASVEIRGPRYSQKGTMGDNIWLELELKTLADAGLVGLPNAGKSSFLDAVSQAHPKIAPYPFTTLNPYVGCVDYDDYWQMTLADIPGLIKGASENRGLGHAFLRHVERSKMLVYVIDISGEDPVNDYKTLLQELEAYKPGLTTKPSMIIANKSDLPGTEEKYVQLSSACDCVLVPISAKYGRNIKEATSMMRRIVSSSRNGKEIL